MVVSSAYLRLLIILPAILIPAYASSSLAFCMMYSAYKLNKQGDNVQPWCTPFPIWNQSIVPCPVLTVASSPAYRFLAVLGCNLKNDRMISFDWLQIAVKDEALRNSSTYGNKQRIMSAMRKRGLQQHSSEGCVNSYRIHGSGGFVEKESGKDWGREKGKTEAETVG